MHEWHTLTNTNILSLINSFIGYEYNTDYSGNREISQVSILDKSFTTEEDAINYVTRYSYGGSTAYLVKLATKTPTKAFTTAYNNFIEKRKAYVDFEKNLTIGYGRKSSKVTCPYCGSSINLKYGNHYKTCPVCGSKKVISDSNYKALELKKKLMEKAATTLSTEAAKNNVTFVCGFEWHC